MERELAEYLRLPEVLEEVAFDLVALVTSNDVVSHPNAHHVQSLLVARIINDLRASVLLCVRGYTMQGWAVAASCFEHSYSIGYIGRIEERAKAWLAHSDFKSPPWGCYDSILHTLTFLGVASNKADREVLVKREYRLYERLCMGKHGNPIAERNRYIARAQDGTTRLVFTPAFSKGRIKEARICLLIASRAVGTGLWAYLHAHAPGAHEIQERLLGVVGQTHAYMSALNEPDAV